MNGDNMDRIKIGVIVNTHGIKGEIRIISKFDYKDRVFKIGNILYTSDNEELKIDSYRKHKNFDMITFNGINDIRDVLKYKGKYVYFDKDKLMLNDNEYLDEDLIGLDVYFNNDLMGKLDNIELNANRKLFVVNGKLIPYNDNFIEMIDLSNNKIVLKNIENLI
jgi:16S rRNA processing protein RimM